MRHKMNAVKSLKGILIVLMLGTISLSSQSLMATETQPEPQKPLHKHGHYRHCHGECKVSPRLTNDAKEKLSRLSKEIKDLDDCSREIEHQTSDLINLFKAKEKENTKLLKALVRITKHHDEHHHRGHHHGHDHDYSKHSDSNSERDKESVSSKHSEGHEHGNHQGHDHGWHGNHHEWYGDHCSPKCYKNRITETEKLLEDVLSDISSRSDDLKAINKTCSLTTYNIKSFIKKRCKD